MASDTAPRPQKTAMLVAQRIVADIDRRGNQVGDRLPPERIMLEQYQVGRGTLRESLRFLELQGIINLRPGPGGGPVVQRPDAGPLAATLTLLLQFADAPLRAIAESRAHLATTTAGLAAEQMSEAKLVELRDSADIMERRVRDRGACADQYRRFHLLVAHGSGNAVFGVLIEALLRVLTDTALNLDDVAARRAAAAAHRGIAEAIAARDGDAARRAMADYLGHEMRDAERASPGLLDAPITWIG